MDLSRITPRLAYGAGSAICAGLLAFALYLQHYEYQDPCPLCIVQRVAYIALMLVFLAGAAHGPRRRGAITYSSVAVVLSAAGAAVAGRHVWLQHLPADQVPACGPGLEYMIRQFPFAEMVSKVLAGSGQCAEAGWRMLGLSIAEWSLVWFVLLGALAVWTAIKAR